jgi:hypothetical protein
MMLGEGLIPTPKARVGGKMHFYCIFNAQFPKIRGPRDLVELEGFSFCFVVVLGVVLVDISQRKAI